MYIKRDDLTGMLLSGNKVWLGLGFLILIICVFVYISGYTKVGMWVCVKVCVWCGSMLICLGALA